MLANKIFNYLNFMFRLQQLNDVAMTLLLSAHVNSRGSSRELTWNHVDSLKAS